MYRMILVLLPFIIAADWPQFMGPKRDGISTEKEIAAWDKAGPKTAWSFTVGSGWSAPIVVQKKVLIHHRVDDKEVLDCLDLDTGKSLFRGTSKTRYRDDFNFDDGPRATPTVVNDTVFTLGADGDLSAWDLKAGQQLWTRNINKDYDVPKGFFGVATSPLIVGEKLLVNVGGKGAGIVAFDPKTGKEIWKVSDQGVSYSSPVLAKIDGEELAVFFTRQGLFAVTPDKGEQRYQFDWRPRINASVNGASPIVDGNRIFLSTSYSRGAVLLDAKKGEVKEIWSNDTSMSCHFNTPVLVQEHLFGIDGRQEGGTSLRCVELATGKVKWTEKGFGCASLIHLGKHFLSVTENGDLVLFAASTKEYQELARATILTNPVRANIAYSNGKLLARDKTKLVAIELSK